MLVNESFQYKFYSIGKMSKLESDLRKSDIRTYVDENLLQVTKKLDQKYSEMKDQLAQQETDFEKEKHILGVKIERISRESNNHKTQENILTRNSGYSNNTNLATTNNNICLICVQVGSR